MAWTTISADTSWQDLAVAEQIVRAFNKRVLALTEAERTLAGVSLIFESRDANENDEVFDVVYALQDGIEKLYWLFADPTSAVSAAGGPYDTLADFQSAAGLTGTGIWRRIAAVGTQPAEWTDYAAAGWAYGKIQDGDLAGPWLWIDLQNALDVLKRRVFGWNKGYGDFTDSSCYRDLPYQTATRATFQPATNKPFNAGSPVSYEIGGLAGSMYAWKQLRRVSDGGGGWVTYWDFAVEASAYITASVSGLGTQPKNVSLVGYASWDHGAIGSSWSGSDFGTGWPDADSEDALLPLVFASASGTSDTFEATIPPQMASGWGDWGDFLAYISWPSPTLPAQAETKRHSGSLLFQATHLVVDYAFDP